MLKFKYSNTIPPGGLFYLDVECKDGKTVVLDNPSKLQLRYRATEFYMANGMDVPPNLDVLIENSTCHRVHPAFCEGNEPRRFEVPRGEMEVLSNTQEFLTGNRERILVIDADRRIATCLTCPNHQLGWCTECSGFRKHIEGLVGKGCTTHDTRRLGACRAFGVAIHALACAKNAPAKRPPVLPRGCWL